MKMEYGQRNGKSGEKKGWKGEEEYWYEKVAVDYQKIGKSQGDCLGYGYCDGLSETKEFSVIEDKTKAYDKLSCQTYTQTFFKDLSYPLYQSKYSKTLQPPLFQPKTYPISISSYPKLPPLPHSLSPSKQLQPTTYSSSSQFTLTSTNSLSISISPPSDLSYNADFTSQQILKLLRPSNRSNIKKIKQYFYPLQRYGPIPNNFNLNVSATVTCY